MHRSIRAAPLRAKKKVDPEREAKRRAAAEALTWHLKGWCCLAVGSVGCQPAVPFGRLWMIMADCFSIKGVAMGDIGTWTISSETQDVSERG